MIMMASLEQDLVYIGSGSNLGDRLAHLHQARELIKTRIGSLVRESSVYQSEPWGDVEQPWFYNQVIAIQTDLPPHAVLDCLLEIEREMGRVREERFGPRIIDLDILLYGQQIISDSILKIPHPRMTVRNFVLIPLMEITSDLKLPDTELTIEELYLANQEELVVCLLEEDQ